MLFSIAGGDGDADGVDKDSPGIPKAFELFGLLSSWPALFDDDDDDDDEHEEDDDEEYDKGEDEGGDDNGNCDGGGNVGDCEYNGMTSPDDPSCCDWP